MAGFNLGILMRALFGSVTPKSWADVHCEAVLACFAGRICCLLAIWPPVGEHEAHRPLIIGFELIV